MIVDKNELHEYYETEKSATFMKFDLNMSACSSYCLSLFSVVNQFSVVNILAEYNNPTQRRINKVSVNLLLTILVGHQSSNCPINYLFPRCLYGLLVNRI
jgi:hypothetical protein